MNPVEEFIERMNPGNQQEIMQFMHLHLLKFNLTPKIRYKIPFYDQNKWVCYLNPLKNDEVELVFLQAQKFTTHHPILQDNGRKMVKGITLSSVDSLPLEVIDEILNEALTIDHSL